MKKFMTQSLMLCAGIAAAADIGSTAQTQNLNDYRQDWRYLKLRTFMDRYDCPVRHLAQDFLAASDRNHLDWRLLPSISLVESGGGKVYRNNNIMGWANGKKRFASVPAGIHHVAHALRHAGPYRHKDLDALLLTYNPNPIYPKRVKGFMKELGESTPAASGPALQAD
jgi:hypothetical protein